MNETAWGQASGPRVKMPNERSDFLAPDYIFQWIHALGSSRWQMKEFASCHPNVRPGLSFWLLAHNGLVPTSVGTFAMNQQVDNVCVCMCLCESPHINKWIQISTYISLITAARVLTYDVHIYIYRHICIDMHTHMYTYTHTGNHCYLEVYWHNAMLSDLPRQKTPVLCRTADNNIRKIVIYCLEWKDGWGEARGEYSISIFKLYLLTQALKNSFGKTLLILEYRGTNLGLEEKPELCL